MYLKISNKEIRNTLLREAIVKQIVQERKISKA